MKSQYTIQLHIQEQFPYKAKLKLLENSWHIEYKDEDDNTIISVWMLDNIKRFNNPDGSITFKHLQIPFEAFETLDQVLLDTISKEYSGYSFSKSPKPLLIQQWQFITALLALIIGTIALLYFWLLPAIALWAVNKIPVESEISLGKSLHESFLNHESIDKELTELTQQFADSIDFKSAYPIKITVINDTILNAFALPGGYIVVYSKMLQSLESYDQLAALLSHEVSHITQRHSLNSVAKNLSGIILIKLIVGSTSGFSAFLIENLNRFKQLSYSRELEHDADANGLIIMKENNIDQNGMVGLLTILQKTSKESNIPTFMSTHPLSSERKKYATVEAAKQKVKSPHLYLESTFNNIQKLLNE